MGMVVFSSCRQDEVTKYERPEWLSGKLYTQITSEENLDSFAVALGYTGYDTIVDASGSFTIFAPTNDAFINFLNEDPNYTSIKDIPKDLLDRLVKYHVVQNQWTLNQLQSLDIYGWIDEDDPNNNEPRGYKRQTVLQEDNKKYWVDVMQGDESIVDSTRAEDYRMVYTASRKYVPLFFDHFLQVAEIDPNDYEYFFNAPYASGNMHYASARVISPEIYAENGIVYKIDRVVSTLPNAEQLLKQDYDGYSYSSFLNSIYQYAEFDENPEATARQPGYEQGLDVDELYDLTFPELTFDVNSEFTGPGRGNEIYTIRFHNGLIAPTNAALDELFNDIITANSGYPHWPDKGSVPESVYKIIVNSHMSNTPVYSSDLSGGVKNGLNDDIIVDPQHVIQKSYASNCTFLGISKAIVPRAFSSVAGPVYLRPGFSVLRQAMELANVMPAIKRKNQTYAFFITPDLVMAIDSSMMVDEDDKYQYGFRIRSYDRAEERFETRNQSSLMLHFLNHVGTSLPMGSARKEFIPNLAGNYIVFDNENNEVTGGMPSMFGYNGDSAISLNPEQLEEPADNGITYEIDGFLRFPETSLYSLLLSYPAFAELLGKAGFIDSVYYELNHIAAGEKYTIFMPSEEAIENSGVDTMSRSELEQLIKYHIVRGDIIFTDGKKPSGDYATLRIDESSTVYQTRYSPLKISTAPDMIDILNEDGSLYYQVEELEGETNIMFSEDIDPDNQRTNYVTKGALHVIDTILVH